MTLPATSPACEATAGFQDAGRTELDAEKLDEIARELLDVRARVTATLAFFEDAISKISLPAGPKFPGFDFHAHDRPP